MIHTPRILCLLGALSSSACLIPLGGEQIGEIRIGWSFPDGASCGSLGVDTIEIQVLGDERGGGAEASCVESSVLIPSLPPGSYDIFIDALGTDARFTAREKIDVEAGFTSDEGVVLLRPTLGPDGTHVSLRWSFEGDPSCARAEVGTMDVLVNSGDDVVLARSFPCTDGGATLGGLPEGDVAIELVGRGGERALYQGAASETLGVFARDLGLIDLAPLYARTQLTWSFAGDPRCELAGVTDVSVQVIDDDGVAVLGRQTDCLAGGIRFTTLPPEHLTFVVEGMNGSSRAWQNTAAVTLVAGDNPGVSISLEPASASARVRWLFADAGDTGDCAAVGAASVTLQVFDAAGGIVAGGSFPCAQGAANLEGLSAGAHRFVADAFGPTGTLVAQDTSGTPRGVTQTLALGDNDVDVVLE